MSLDSKILQKVNYKNKNFVPGEQYVLGSSDESLPQIKVDKQSL
jgi:hypothetical protein